MSAHFRRADGGKIFLFKIYTASFSQILQNQGTVKQKRFLNPVLPLKSLDIWTFFISPLKKHYKSITYKLYKKLTATKTRDFLSMQDFNSNKMLFVRYLSKHTKINKIFQNMTRQHFIKSV